MVRPRPPRMPRPATALVAPFTGRPPLARSTSTAGGRGDTAFADAVSSALFGRVAPVPVAPHEPEPPGDDHMRPTVGSILQFTPDARGWLAALSDEEGQHWHEPVVGWAVVVTWAAYSADAEGREEGDESEFQSDVQPVLFSGEGTELMMFREGVTLDALIMPGLIAAPGHLEK